MAIVWFVLLASFYLLKSSEAQTVSLSVTPPSPVVGQEVTFTCTASQDITTNTQVFYKRNTLLVGRFFVNSTSCTVTPQGDQNYIFTCGSLPVRHVSLTIPADYVTEDDHGKDWTCEIFLGTVSNTVQLTLSVPVSTVTITTDGVYRPSVTISAGNTHTFTCTTTASRPVARLSWFRGDNNITDQASTATDQDMGEDKYTRQQGLSITGRVNDVDSGLKCEAVNIYGRTPVSSQTSTVIVQYLPETEVSVGGYDQNAQLTETSMVSMYCTVRGGKPVPTLTFTCPGIMNTPKISENGGYQFSNITFTTVRQLNGRQCSCTGNQSSTPWTSNGQSKTFNVKFGPDGVNFSGINGQLTENSSVNLKCSSNESNPVPVYKWTTGSAGISVASQVVESDGAYNGKITSQIWARNLSRYDDGVVITCTVSSPDRRRSVSTTTTLSVLYQPYISVASSLQSPVIEGRKLTLTCDVDSNPDSSGTWSRPVSQSLPWTTQINGVLVITSVSRHDNGTYRCTATNSQKTNMLHIDISVHYPPDQMTIMYNNITCDDDKATRYLRCSPDGNPRSFTFLKWQHLSVYGQLIRELDGVTSGQESVLTILDPGLDTRYQDTGYYICRVENGVPDMNGKLIFSQREFFNVKAPPVFELKSSVFPGQKETSINISISFYSTSGLGMVELFRNQSVVSNRFVLNTVPTNISLTFHGTNITVGGFTTEISVQTFQQEDFGNYTLNVTNEVGVQQFGFYLKAAGPPDAPTDLQITETSVKSIRVKWTAGFDGGSKQHFIVEYATEMSVWNKLPKIPQSKVIESVTISHLREETFYMIRIYAGNSLGFSDIVFINTSTNEKCSPTSNTDMFNASIVMLGTGVTALLSTIVIIAVLVKRKGACLTKGKVSEPPVYLENMDAPVTSPSGVDRVLYEVLDSDARMQQSVYESIGKPSCSKDAAADRQQYTEYETLHGRSQPNTYEELGTTADLEQHKNNDNINSSGNDYVNTYINK